ncbi:hypothetical protein KIL84_021517 [Mauremys mutica]|uniref:Uncharacterized protein n=1 Tax=Mauremys mutica TaxID=74926 RepID=A0A9D3X923_9SAUR|nr:hypothetical protein KIL84_021517 [Mauremys mutica]
MPSSPGFNASQQAEKRGLQECCARPWCFHTVRRSIAALSLVFRQWRFSKRFPVPAVPKRCLHESMPTSTHVLSVMTPGIGQIEGHEKASVTPFNEGPFQVILSKNS